MHFARIHSAWGWWSFLHELAWLGELLASEIVSPGPVLRRFVLHEAALAS